MYEHKLLKFKKKKNSNQIKFTHESYIQLLDWEYISYVVYGDFHVDHNFASKFAQKTRQHQQA